MKKKLLSALLVTTMVAGMFAGCGKDDGGEASKPSDTQSSSDSQATQAGGSGTVYLLNSNFAHRF